MHAPLIEALWQWHEFFALIGTAAATLVGLLFVAASIGAGVFTRSHQAGIRSFLSPTVVHFTAVLIMCLIGTAPSQTPLSLGILLMCAGAIGGAYSSWIWRRMRVYGITPQIDVVDRLWYTFLPMAVYLLIVGAGLRLTWDDGDSLELLALGMVMLLVIGIRNAWDMTVWVIDRRTTGQN
jgi:hypothetical protein